MSSLHRLSFAEEGPLRVARTAGRSRLTQIAVARVDGGLVVTTGDGETCAIVVTGTFDLRGGHTQWQNRGARTDPYAGRPIAVFLPPRTEFAAERGQGELVLVEAMKPPAQKATGREALRQSPLLQLSGSGKSFDPTRGEWMPAESFPTAAESLPPRRIAQVQCGGTRVERVFAADYKAETLVVDEAVVPDRTTFDLAQLPLPTHVDEALVFVRCDGDATVRMGNEQIVVRGDAVVHATGPARNLTITTGDAKAYVVLATGPK